MNDLLIFAIGSLVTLIVASAVGLLLWGAANEPRGTLITTKTKEDESSASRKQPTPPPAPRRLGSESTIG